MDRSAKGGDYDFFLESGACPVIATLDHQAEKPMMCGIYHASSWHAHVLLAMPLLLGNVVVKCCV
jgi:hypothetical protein